MSPARAERRLVQVLMRAVQAALRVRRVEPPASRVRDETDAALQFAFGPVWDRASRIELAVRSGAIEWEGDPVLEAEDDGEGLIASLAEAGIESVTLVPGVEVEEIRLVLTAIAAARGTPGAGSPDLLTLLFRADLNHVEYSVAGPDSSAAGPDSSAAGHQLRPDPAARGPRLMQPPRIGGPVAPPTAAPDAVRDTVRREAGGVAGRDRGVVQLEKFDSTLYFLDEREVEYLKSAIDRGYAQDLAINTLTLLLDILELRSEPSVRDEVIGILEDHLPELLGAGRFEAVAHMVAGIREVSQNAEALTEAHKELLDRMRASISHPRALDQLFHALNGGGVEPTPTSMGVLLRELRPTAVRQVLTWSDRLEDPDTRAAVVEALDTFFTEWPLGLSRMLNAPERDVVEAGLELAARLRRPEFIEIVAGVANHDDAGIRRLVARTLSSIGTAQSLRRLVGLVDDANRDVRIVVYRAFAARPFRGAHRALSAALAGKDLEKRGQREKRALFEAFGAVAGGRE